MTAPRKSITDGAITGFGGTVYVSGMTLHPDPRKCPHENDNACPTCDFDRYYADKFGAVCPWSDSGDDL